MKISQLSIFLENHAGVINEVISILGEKSINMRAFSVADGVEFGILRLIVSDVDSALKALSEAGYKVNLTDVIGINTPNDPGALMTVMECLAREDVFIQYMYAFSEGDVASTIFKPTDIDRCIEILERSRDELKSKSPLYKL
ncbi:MAG: amino acid-binding protein [Rikenellaceae bacterium]